MTDSIQATVLTQELAAPSPTVLDIYVVWHSKDKCGRNVFDRLISHYHSEHFSGLAGSAIEVLSRSHPRTTGSMHLRRSLHAAAQSTQQQTMCRPATKTQRVALRPLSLSLSQSLAAT